MSSQSLVQTQAPAQATHTPAVPAAKPPAPLHELSPELPDVAVQLERARRALATKRVSQSTAAVRLLSRQSSGWGLSAISTSKRPTMWPTRWCSAWLLPQSR